MTEAVDLTLHDTSFFGGNSFSILRFALCMFSVVLELKFCTNLIIMYLPDRMRSLRNRKHFPCFHTVLETRVGSLGEREIEVGSI